MATTIWFGENAVSLWGDNAQYFTVKDSARAITAGADTFTIAGHSGTTVSLRNFATAALQGSGTSIIGSTVAGPTSGKLLGISGDPYLFITPPLAADVTISGTVNFSIFASESNMSANATIVCNVYRIDSEGALTLIISSSFGNELSTNNQAKSWSGTPTSTAMKQGDRIAAMLLTDDATGVTMASGHQVSAGFGGGPPISNDNISTIQFTETFSFLSSAPSGTTYYLRDLASDITPGAATAKQLSTTQGSGTGTLTHTTITGPIAFPGDMWTVSAGGNDVEFYTPRLNAFTLEGLVRCALGQDSALEAAVSYFATMTVELARVDSDGSNPVIWARSYTATRSTAGPTTILDRYLSGSALSIDGHRLRLRIYADDSWPNAQVSGTNRTIRYDGTSTYASLLQFTQTVTEFVPSMAVPIVRTDRRIIPLI